MKHMPFRQQVQSLRDRARRLREIGDSQPTPLSEQLRTMADELDRIADESEPKDRDAVRADR